MSEEKLFFEEEVYSLPEFKFSFPIDKELITTIVREVPQGTILDIGCGEGGDSLYLAEKGYKVTAIDISQKAINAIQAEAVKRKITLTTIKTDIELFPFTKSFDIILARGILHFLSEEAVQQIIKKIKKATKLIVVDVFLKGSSCQKDSEGYYFSLEELKQHFLNWDILEEDNSIDEEGNKSQYLVLKKK
jgi:tellurite methyltransferase